LKKVLLYILVALVLFGLPLIAYTSDEFRGATRCRACHMSVFRSWSATGHATAFEILRPGVKAEEKLEAGLDPGRDYTADAACIACHTTGSSALLPGVQCEACHGPGKGYSSATIMNRKKWSAEPETCRTLAKEAGLVVAPPESTCRSCHNEKSPTYKPFDYSASYDEVTHPQ
jgi:hypothetical protein